jgi:hypothetical protein
VDAECSDLTYHVEVRWDEEEGSRVAKFLENEPIKFQYFENK